MDESVISQILGILLGVLFGILIILILVYVILRFRFNKRAKNKNDEEEINVDSEPIEKPKVKKNNEQQGIQYTKQSIFDFMEFDTIEDNMIIQKELKKYIMIIECQGINYDLMSQMEKVSVEEGFQQFLNTLRHPIQIYIQTRTINLEDNINRYRDKIKEIEQKYNKMLYEYRRMQEVGAYSQDELRKYFYELTKQKNLLDYGKDIVANTEKMSLNKNILNKKYYVVVSYYVEESNSDKYDKEEIRNIAFSELYTKSQALIRSLSACSVSGKILDSKELVELLYMAYNRDDAEVYGLNTVLDAQYDSLYSTSQDVFEKKLRVLDEIVQEKAIDLANEKIEKVRTDLQKKAEEKENSMERLVQAMAKVVLRENRGYVGGAVADKAIEEIDKDNEEGGSANEEEVKKTTRGRKRKSVNE